MLQLRVRGDQEAMAMKGYSAFPKSPRLQFHNQIVSCLIQGTRCWWCGILPLGRVTVGVFYSLQPTGQFKVWKLPSLFFNINIFCQVVFKEALFTHKIWIILKQNDLVRVDLGVMVKKGYSTFSCNNRCSVLLKAPLLGYFLHPCSIFWDCFVSYFALMEKGMNPPLTTVGAFCDFICY